MGNSAYTYLSYLVQVVMMMEKGRAGHGRAVQGTNGRNTAC